MSAAPQMTAHEGNARGVNTAHNCFTPQGAGMWGVSTTNIQGWRPFQFQKWAYRVKVILCEGRVMARSGNLWQPIELPVPQRRPSKFARRREWKAVVRFERRTRFSRLSGYKNDIWAEHTAREFASLLLTSRRGETVGMFSKHTPVWHFLYGVQLTPVEFDVLGRQDTPLRYLIGLLIKYKSKFMFSVKSRLYLLGKRLLRELLLVLAESKWASKEAITAFRLDLEARLTELDKLLPAFEELQPVQRPVELRPTILPNAPGY